MSVIDCRCGARIEMHEIATVVTCMCGSRHVWSRWGMPGYVADPACRDCGAPAMAYRDGYDEPLFLCDAHERARWAYP